MNGYNDEIKPRDLLECPKCFKSFKPTKNYQICCSEKCDQLIENVFKEMDVKIYNRKCRDCGCSFRKPSQGRSQVVCDTCKKFYNRETARLSYEKKKDNTEKKKSSRLPLHELNRRFEYARVMDNSGWDHYLKGRKWDRI